MARSKKERPVRTRVDLGPYGRCPDGHNAVSMTTGKDALGKFQDVWCTAPGCKAPLQRLREQHREGA